MSDQPHALLQSVARIFLRTIKEQDKLRRSTEVTIPLLQASRCGLVTPVSPMNLKASK
ncbi:MAG TPA: hypothetical protein VLA12_01560 [Planctomycetaceae bacterium]|nr:hypothetical protein [Planctomycetaceae bacterium]